ncbi:hypothetical protein [Alteromonas sp. W364]|uniref:hypothetical protein n=1 Tax=Alteromonas sp. W364 TaxID=3075610 RepID=UPI0028857DA4|nr:hypothetical protein [Alteromonas sp. W364]MDT0630098.1 hypothetical protein [Alteromonas sp. W364]
MLIFIISIVFFFDPPEIIKIVFIIFSFLVFAFAYQAYRNSIFSKKDLPHLVTVHELKAENKLMEINENKPKYYGERLREIEQLYKDELLSEEEYAAKRRDILDENWGN